jgi:hypothetical protein
MPMPVNAVDTKHIHHPISSTRVRHRLTAPRHLYLIAKLTLGISSPQQLADATATSFATDLKISKSPQTTTPIAILPATAEGERT